MYLKMKVMTTSQLIQNVQYHESETAWLTHY